MFRVRKHQSQLKEARIQVEVEKASEILSGNKSCVKCLEQKRKLMNATAKLQQRKNALAKREAAVLARAQSLRRLRTLLRDRIEATNTNASATHSAEVEETSPPSASSTASGEQDQSNLFRKIVVCRDEDQENEGGSIQQQQQCCEEGKVEIQNGKTFEKCNEQTEAKFGNGDAGDGEEGSGLEVVAHLQTLITAKGVHERSSQVPATIMEEEEHIL